MNVTYPYRAIHTEYLVEVSLRIEYQRAEN